jgi:hypothetical protein
LCATAVARSASSQRRVAQQAHAPDREHARCHVNQRGRAAGDARRYAASVVGARLESEGMIIAQKYRSLIESYLNHAIDVNELMARFDEYFYGEDENLPKDLFLILNDTFGALDCYMPDTPPEQETDTRISETTLRTELAEICGRLDDYMKEASTQPAA